MESKNRTQIAQNKYIYTKRVASQCSVLFKPKSAEEEEEEEEEAEAEAESEREK